MKPEPPTDEELLFQIRQKKGEDLERALLLQIKKTRALQEEVERLEEAFKVLKRT